MAVLTDAAVWGRVSGVLAPPERLLPSEWAARYRVLKPGTTEQPGKWRNDYFPWQPQIVDIPVTEPDKRGTLEQKAAQIGGSENRVNQVGWFVCERPGPILYLISTDDLAREFSLDRFSYMIESAPILRDRFFLGKQHRETIQIKRFAGGKLAILGSQSPNKLMSDPYCYVMLDEVDRLPNFPHIGSAFALAEARAEAFTRSFITGWSTPTGEDVGIAMLMDKVSDQRRFFVACPHCEKEQWLKFGQVKIRERRPELTTYECEHCGAEITDGQRAAAVYRGRYRTTLEPAEAKTRPFAGFYISQLYNPRKPIGQIASRYLSCNSEGDLQVFYNAVLGEPYTPAARPVTDEDIERRSLREPKQTAPGDTRFVTAGIDFQAGDWFYVDISGWTPDGVKHLLYYDRIMGLPRVDALLRQWTMPAEDGRKLKVICGAIDTGFETKRAYQFCRKMGTSFLLPVRYGLTKQGEFWKRDLIKSERICIYKMSRAYWMDRAIGRFAGSDEFMGVMLPTKVTDEYRKHILSNARTETLDRFGVRKLTWLKPRGEHDDYLQAAVYAEFAAVMLGLDELGGTVPAVKRAAEALEDARPEVDGREAWVQRSYRKERKKGGWIRR